MQNLNHLWKHPYDKIFHALMGALFTVGVLLGLLFLPAEVSAVTVVFAYFYSREQAQTEDYVDNKLIAFLPWRWSKGAQIDLVIPVVVSIVLVFLYLQVFKG